jgi:hypothetical protein
MGEVVHVREGEDQRMPNGQSEAQIAFGVDWGVARPSQSPLQAGENNFGARYLMVPRLVY